MVKHKHTNRSCNNAWCNRELCECDDHVHMYGDYDRCPMIPKTTHHHRNPCDICDDLVMETCRLMFAQALKATEEEITKQMEE